MTEPGHTAAPGGRLLRFREDIAEMNDLFSASWLMNIERFMGIDTDSINTVEDGCFQPFRQYPDDVRMTRDWLDFAVEHLSKWWKVIKIFHHRATLESFTASLDGFGHESPDDLPGPGLSDTIAIVAFMPYADDTGHGRTESFTASVLNAGLRSMSRYGMGRVVVAVPTAADRATYEPLVPDRIGTTQIVFRVIPKARTKFIPTNVPYGAIVGLQNAFASDDDDWLGGETRWDSVYLTEPDTLLHLKPPGLSDLLDGVVHQGWILSPHRLQPIPHESDLPEPLSPVVIVPDHEDHRVQTIDSYATCLIDAGDERPEFEHCGNFWYLCGFQSGDHSRLVPYDLMRLSHGVGITMLMGSEHGRQCHITP